MVVLLVVLGMRRWWLLRVVMRRMGGMGLARAVRHRK